jgi:hypothetical protein
MEQHETIDCEFLMSYLTGECSELERAEFERHLQFCSACREEMKDLELVWKELPYQMDEHEVPLDLKSEVMEAIGRLDQDSINQLQAKSKRTRSFLWIYGFTAAIIVGIVIGAFWNHTVVQKSGSLIVAPLSIPARVTESFELKSVDASMPLAKGTVWVLQQGNMNNIVFNLQGLEETKGDWAYQAWLIHNGKRYNCGTLHVDEKGIGVLTYEISGKSLNFDAIGVTLEPDPNGDQPRGKKVLGS